MTANPLAKIADGDVGSLLFSALRQQGCEVDKAAGGHDSRTAGSKLQLLRWQGMGLVASCAGNARNPKGT
ncbi:hypothetical protein UVI_02010430 [Ustilaginoidea virens]|uniref:Uncharacterized protein n=1 Tax=Ustilaginoidea virens TaxID=1159556 RepID=A0A1B5KZ96_USTVR|nr:hypothetical protein UVI_02010430 [Ustilaginoidea virens]